MYKKHFWRVEIPRGWGKKRRQTLRGDPGYLACEKKMRTKPIRPGPGTDPGLVYANFDRTEKRGSADYREITTFVECRSAHRVLRTAYTALRDRL